MQIALGDLSDPASFRNALRGRQDRGPPGGVDPRPAARLDRGAERRRHAAAGARRRARARRALRVLLGDRREPPLARRASSGPRRSPSAPSRSRTSQTTVFAPSIVYSPDDPWVTLLRAHVAACPRCRSSGRGEARYQPIWADDVADCVIAALDGRERRRAPALRPRRARDAHLRRHRARGRCARWRPPAAAAARAAAGRATPACARSRPCSAPAGVRDLGRGGADGDPDDDRRAAAPTPSRSACSRSG